MAAHRLLYGGRFVPLILSDGEIIPRIAYEI